MSGNTAKLTVKLNLGEGVPHGTYAGVVKAIVTDNPTAKAEASFDMQLNDPCVTGLLTLSVSPPQDAVTINYNANPYSMNIASYFSLSNSACTIGKYEC